MREYNRGKKVDEICRELHCAKSTFYSWVKPYTERRNQYGVVRPKDLDTARRKIDKLEAELEILQHSDAIQHMTTKEKELAVDAEYGNYSVHALCDAFGLSTGTYYNHRKRNKKERAWFYARRTTLYEVIKEIFDESRQTYGVKRVREALRKRGYKVSEKYVRELMQDLGLGSVQTDRKSGYKEAAEKRQLEKMQKVLVAERPNMVWTSDMTQVSIKGRRYYICVYLDLYSRVVLAYDYGRVPSTNLAMRTVRAATKRHTPPRGLIIHTDNGGPYVAYTMRRWAAHHGFVLSYSRPGHPVDNATMESFFSTLRKELFGRCSFMSEVEFSRILDDYIEFYNTERMHSGLDYKTPMEKNGGQLDNVI